MGLNNKVINENPAIVWVGLNALHERLDSYYYNPIFIRQYSKMTKGKVGVIGEFFNVTKLSGFEYTKHFTDEALKAGDVVAITSQNVADCNLNIKETNTIKIPRKLHNDLKRSQLKIDDIVLSYTGHYRRAAVINGNIGEELHLGPNVCKLSPINTNIDSAFLCVYFNSYSGQVYLDREKTISAQPTVNMDRIRNMEFPLPSIDIQGYIGDKLRKAEYLKVEAMKLKREAEDLIDRHLKLEDLRAKINLPNVKQKWNYVSNDEFTGRLDPEHYKMKFSILNEHLELLDKINIKVLNLEDILEKGSYGILPSSSDYGKGELTFIRSTDLKDYMIDFDSCEKVPIEYNVEKARVSSGEILLEIKGSISSGAIVPNGVNEGIVNGSIYKFSVKEEFNNYYILAILQSLIGQLQKEKHGANSVISYLSLDVIQSLQIPVLTKSIQDKIGSNLERYVINLLEAKKLVKNAKQDVGSLIEGNFDESKINAEQ
ncbi:restriction endonuclease subunit S [Bacillus spizizenii]|nr:restriction endonuclease subunit S [Bacillus spizizenii]